LYRIVLCRLRYDLATRAYAERRTKQGLSKPEIIRCLKRYVLREVYRTLVSAATPKKILLRPLDIHRSIHDPRSPESRAHRRLPHAVPPARHGSR
jgi:hypothetical protein